MNCWDFIHWDSVKFENLGMKNPLSNSAFLKKGQLQKLKEILIRYNLNNNKKEELRAKNSESAYAETRSNSGKD